jgi:RNA polymerase sigma-70 factor (ECF subfamily)
LSGASSSPPTARQAQLLALASELRPELHRYCARLMGSVIDAAMLDLTVNAVKAHLARGRARLKAVNAHALAQPAPRSPSPDVARYVALFNRRDWDGLRAMLADDVRLIQSTYPLRAGAADVGMFFGIYAKIEGVRLAPAWLEGREVIAVWEDPQAEKPSYLMWLEWKDGRISFIRDYRYVRYIVDDAELVLAPDTAPPGEGANHG